MLLSTTTGQYSLSATSPFWTESLTITNSTGLNPAGTNVINLANTSGFLAGEYADLVLDNNTMFYTTILSVGSNTITVTNNLTFSMNNAGTAYNFTSPAQPPQVIDWVSLRDSNGNDIFIDILTYEEFTSLPAKQSPIYQSDPTAIYYETHLVGNAGQGYGLLNLDVDGVVDLTKYLVINFVQEIQDWVNETDEPDFEKQWFQVLVMGLARNLAPYVNAVWTQNQETMYKEALALAMSADPKKLRYSFSRRNNADGWRNPPHR